MSKVNTDNLLFQNRNIETILARQQDAYQVNANGDYVFTSANPVMLMPNDSLIVKNVFIDTQKLTQENIVLSEDTTVTLSFLYFENNTDYTDKVPVEGSAGYDNNIYVMYHHDVNTGVRSLIIGTVNVTIPAGSYSPDRIAQFLTEEYSKTLPMRDATVKNPNNNFLIPTSYDLGGGAVKSLNNIDWGKSPYPYGSIAALSGPMNSWGPTGNDGLAYYLGDGRGDQGFGPNGTAFGGGWISLADGVDQPSKDSDYHITSSNTNGGGSGLSIKIQPTAGSEIGWFGPLWSDGESPSSGKQIYYEIVSTGDGYNVGDEVYFTSDQFAYVSNDAGGTAIYERLGSGGTLTLVVESISDGDSYNEFIRLGDNPQAPTESYRYNNATYFVGASEIDLEYNDNNNQNFSFDYLHTPLYKEEPNEPLQPAVELEYDVGSQLWTTVDVDSGILLTDMQPRSFWKGILNFNVDAIVMRDANGDEINHTTQGPLGSADGKYTKGYLGVNGFLNTAAGGAQARKITDDSQTIATTLTVPISAGEFNTQSDEGYYLVQIFGVEASTVLTDDRRVSTSCIVSKYYNQNNIVSGAVDSCIPYVHYGAPTVFNTFRVRILDPVTMDVVNNLGAFNTLVLQVMPASIGS